MGTGRLPLRLVVGGYFVGHGTQKLLGRFGGRSPAATATIFDRLGLHPGRRNAIAAETAGGAALAPATPATASILTGTMITATRSVHLKNGPRVAKGATSAT
jgi:putative oxidoreductase